MIDNTSAITAAAALAQEMLGDQLRGNGDPFMSHVEAVAAIVEKEIRLPQESVAAVYLHEATRSHHQVMDRVRRDFPPEICRVVEGLNRIATINPRDTQLQAEKYRKLIVSYSTDPQVTLIKLADRLEVMRSLETCFPKTLHVQKATETFMLYAPLAHQLGLYRIKSELEDLAFKVTQPVDYRLITNYLRADEIERMAQIKSFVAPLESELRATGIEYELKSRTKTVYSIWRKMQAQQVGVDGVFDILAIRFIIEALPEKEKEFCWQVYSIVTHIYEPIQERMRDWITVPKASGYESLHTTVKTRTGLVVEVQIRSRRMDLVDEYGVAAHWIYKGIRREQELQQWLNKVRQRLQVVQEQEAPASAVEIPQDKAVDDKAADDQAFRPGEIYVFTPTGDLRSLPDGATLLDFAFEIHTNVGVHCTGGRINGKMAQLRDKLHTGDTVEIITVKNQKPSKDWLTFVVSGKAKNKIRQKLREEAGIMDIQGREIFERRLRNWKMECNPETMGLMLKHFKFKQLSEFYAAIATESLSMQEVKDYLKEQLTPVLPVAAAETPEPPAPAAQQPLHKTGEDYLVIDDKLGRIGYKLAKCCNPIMGDPVFGFVSVKEGVKIHRMTCPNASRLMSQYPYRIQKVRWRQNLATTAFQVTLRFTAYEEMGLTQEVGEVIANLSLNLRNLSFSNQKGKVEGKMQVAVNSNKQVDLLLVSLRKIKGMVKVVRE